MNHKRHAQMSWTDQPSTVENRVAITAEAPAASQAPQATQPHAAAQPTTTKTAKHAKSTKHAKVSTQRTSTRASRARKGRIARTASAIALAAVTAFGTVGAAFATSSDVDIINEDVALEQPTSSDTPTTGTNSTATTTTTPNGVPILNITEQLTPVNQADETVSATITMTDNADAFELDGLIYQLVDIDKGNPDAGIAAQRAVVLQGISDAALNLDVIGSASHRMGRRNL